MNEELEKEFEVNRGVIPGSATKSLWLGGTIPYEVRLESGNWIELARRIIHEKQKDPIESMGCVSFSCNNCLELQYLNEGVEVNFSDRALAKMSGTTTSGNWFDKVADTVRLIGLILESDWPNNPKAQTWEEYYKEIPQSVLAKAVKQPIQYEATEVTVENLKKQLKQSPIQISIRAPHPTHAVTLLHIEGTKATYLDHYAPFIRTIDVSKISYALKIVLTKPTMTNALIVKNGSEFGVYLPATSADGLITLMRNVGLPVPLKEDGTLDFEKVKVDKQLV